jgi:hypothetical protein
LARHHNRIDAATSGQAGFGMVELMATDIDRSINRQSPEPKRRNCLSRDGTLNAFAPESLPLIGGGNARRPVTGMVRC